MAKQKRSFITNTLEFSSIFTFDEYRELIQHRWEVLKFNNARLSFEYAARKLNVRKSYIPMIISKKRHLSQEKVSPVAKLLKMQSLEKEYFFFLYLFNTTQEKDLKKYLLNVLNGYRIAQQVPSMPKDTDESKNMLFENWPRLLLFSLVSLNDFKWSKEWLMSRLTSPADASSITDKVMQDLIENKILQQDGERYLSNRFMFKCSKPNEVESTKKIVSMYLNKALEIVQSPLEYKKGPVISSILALSEGRYNIAIQKMMDLENELWELAATDPNPSHLYLHNSVMKGLTKEISGLSTTIGIGRK